MLYGGFDTIKHQKRRKIFSKSDKSEFPPDHLAGTPGTSSCPHLGSVKNGGLPVSQSPNMTWGYPQIIQSSWMIIVLVLTPLVTWGSPISGNLQ